jgi:hypothetical protein
MILKPNLVPIKAYIVERAANIEEGGSRLESTVMHELDIVFKSHSIEA